MVVLKQHDNIDNQIHTIHTHHVCGSNVEFVLSLFRLYRSYRLRFWFYLCIEILWV